MNIDDKHYDACPICHQVGDNLRSCGASGRTGGWSYDVPGDLTGFHYRCATCDVFFTSIHQLSNNTPNCYAMGSAPKEN